MKIYCHEQAADQSLNVFVSRMVARIFVPIIFRAVLVTFITTFICCSTYGQESELGQLKSQLKNTKDSLTAMRLMNKIGFLIHQKSADSSFYYGVKADQLAEHLNNSRGKADALANIAIGLCLKGLYSESLDYYSKAYHEYALLPDTVEMSQILMNSAVTYSFTSDSSLTVIFAKRALNIVKKLKTDSAMSMLYTNYAELSGISADSVAIYLNKAEKIAAHFHDDRALLFIMQEKAQLLLEKKNNAPARNLILKSLLLATKHKWDYHELESLNLYGTYFLAVNKPDSALQCYLHIYHTANANGYVFWKIDVLKAMLTVYKKQHNLVKQSETNGLLVEALEMKNTNNNSFIGDYIKYSEQQDKLKKLNLVNISNKKKILKFILIIAVGIIGTFFILFGYAKSSKQERKLLSLNKQITIQNESLQRNDEFKNRLLSMLAHDFRTPLNHTLIMIDLLKDNELSADRKQTFFNKIETGVQDILNTFDNILNWIKKQLMGYKPVFEPLNFYELFEQSTSMFKQEIDEKRLIFNNLLDPALSISSDREIIQFINRNLIHNAIKYSPVNGIIKVTAKTKNNENIILSVRNEGKGIAETELESLFTFSERDSVDRGAGMALTLCRDFITLLNGSIWAESILDEGSTFHYSLPLH